MQKVGVQKTGPAFGWEKILCCTVQNSSDGSFEEIQSCEGVGKDQQCSAERLCKTSLWRRTCFEDNILVMA